MQRLVQGKIQGKFKEKVGIAAYAGAGQTSMRRILKENLKTFPYKMQKRHASSTTHQRMPLDRCQQIMNFIKAAHRLLCFWVR